jgi:predicted RNase H-like HicB family nuclease
VPGLDGCFSSGETIDEAKENVKDAIAIDLEDLKEDRKPFPQPNIVDAELIEYKLSKAGNIFP